MKAAIHNLKPEFRPLWRLAGPLILAEMGWMSMGIVDTMMVGRLPASAEAIGAVSVGHVLFAALSLFGGGLLLGLDTLVSQSFGAGRVQDCHHSLLQGTYLSLLLSPLLMGALWLFLPALRSFDIHPTVLPLALDYLNAVVWGIFPLLLYFALRRYLQAMNLVKPVMFALISANGVNVLANWMLIFGHLGAPALGVAGAGWATLVSRGYMAALLLGYMVYYDRRHRTGLWQVSPMIDFTRIGRLLSLGVPAAMQLGVEVVVFAIATLLIARLDPVSLASHQIALNAASFTYMMPLAIGSAAAVRVGQALGRGDPSGAGRAGWAALTMGASFMAAAAAVFLLFPTYIARLFTPDAAIISLSVTLLAVAALFQLFDGLQAVATGALRGAADTRTPMVAHLLSYWLLGLPLGYWLCFRRGLGAVGLWVGLCVALIVIGLVLSVAWHRRTRQSPASVALPAAQGETE